MKTKEWLNFPIPMGPKGKDHFIILAGLTKKEKEAILKLLKEHGYNES